MGLCLLLVMVTIVCYTSKTLSNGGAAYYGKVDRGRRVRYKSIGVSVLAKYWDFGRNRAKMNCPNGGVVLKKILKAELRYACGVGEKSVGSFGERI